MHILFFVWLILGLITFVLCLKNPSSLYIYLATGFAAAAFMAFFGASPTFQLILGTLAVLTAIIFGEGGLHASFLIFAAIDLVVVLIYFLFFR